MPHAIGMAERWLRRNTSRGEISSSAASARASGSQGASVTRSVRRDSHVTTSRPVARRSSTSPAPAAQTASSAYGHEMFGSERRELAAGVWTGPAPTDCAAVGRSVCVRFGARAIGADASGGCAALACSTAEKTSTPP